jgi:hypothetical protein
MVASATGIPSDTYIQTVDSGTQVTLTRTPTTAGTAATIVFAQVKYAMPSDFDRLIDATDWDKSKNWSMSGPETAQQWQWLKSGLVAVSPRIQFRPLGGYFQIWPPTSSNELLGFEYVSNQWVLAAADTVTPSKSSFTVDTDTCVFPDRVMVLGVKKKFFQVKGFAPAFDEDYARELDIAKSNDAGSPTLSMAPRVDGQLLDWNNIPDARYGQ